MKLLEYKAKDLFEQFGIPVMRGCVIDDAATMEKALEEAGLQYPVVVKAQVQIGGRGKAGGIRFADTPEQAQEHCRSLLHSDLLGYRVDRLMIVEKASPQQEWYLSIMLDRLSKRPMIIFSAMGGMDIESVSHTDPDKIIKMQLDPVVGVQEYTARYLLSKAGLDAEYLPQFYALLSNLYTCFCKYDCLLTEINPLAISEGKLIALDGKVDIDDSALYRLPDIRAFRDTLQEEDLVKEARAFRFLYIPVGSEGSIAVASNGSGMLMSCIDLISKEGMKVKAALDLGGGATAERIKEALRILFSTPGVKAVLINIFGGITRCDEVAEGIRLAMSEYGIDKTVIVRMEGTNKEKGLEIVKGIQGDIVSADGLRESVRALAERRSML